MSLFFRRVIASVVLALGIVPVAAAQLDAQSGSITGKVTDASTGRPIENVGVKVQAAGGQAFGGITGPDGSFRVVGLANATYTVTARLIGYESKAMQNVRPGQVVNLALNQAVSTLSQTVVTASRARPASRADPRSRPLPSSTRTRGASPTRPPRAACATRAS
jgi:iron complex outermembrane receptor protein